MRYNTEYKILIKIKKARRGSLFFHEDFTHYGNIEAIKKALQRLVNKGELTRVAHGVYVRPRKDPVLGTAIPGIEDIAKAIAKRDRARIVPSGIFALNKLGLSTQVPLHIVYLTDGAARKINIGNHTIIFKKTTPKNVAAVGEISKLAIQALRTIGKENVSAEEIKKIQNQLKNEKTTRLEHDIRLAPVWIKEIMTPVLKEMKNE
ncbi:MAG: DUF6088 family protein [Candidatus Marinimicrobia bacterium]|nr:DUF6088 family protein [Candidatus Neomarinimicrobiota bacterium]